MRILGWNVEKAKAKASAPGEDEKRPVKLVPDGYNSWRVVYAD